MLWKYIPETEIRRLLGETVGGTPSERCRARFDDSTFILACPELAGIGEQGGVSTYRVISFCLL